MIHFFTFFETICWKISVGNALMPILLDLSVKMFPFLINVNPLIPQTFGVKFQATSPKSSLYKQRNPHVVNKVSI